MVNAFGVEHNVSKAMTPEERAAKKAEQIRQMELRGIKPKEAAPANPPKQRRVSPPPAARERVTKPVAGPPTGIKRATWEITRSQTRNWAIGAGLAAGAAYGAKRIADRNRVSKSERSRDVGATALGGASGLAATKTVRNVGGWVGRETIKDQRVANFDNRHGSEHRKTMSEHNKKYGAVTSNPDVDFAGNKKARYAYFRNYPKSVPGGKGQRLLALEGHPMVKRPVLIAGTAAGALAAHHYAQKQKVAKADSGPTRSHEKKRVPDYVSPLLPASTVRSYDNSRAHKTEAGVKNFAAKAGLGAIGGTAGLLASAVAVRKVPALRNGVKFGSKKAVSRDTLRGWTQSTGAGAGAAAGGGIGGAYSLKRIQDNPKYRYQQ